MKRAWVVASVVLGTAALIIAGAVLKGNAPAAPPPGPEGAAFEPAEAVQVLEAREVEWQPMADLVGTVFARRSVIARNELEGIVRFVGFESGEDVEAGRVLLKQDDSAERADLDAARASVRVAEANCVQAEAQVTLAELELKRLEGLGAGAAAEVDIDRARTRVATARADRGRWAAEADQARARVAQVEARIAKLTIHAPFRAQAGLRTVHEGQYLAAGSDVVALQELADTIFLDFAVPQEYAPLAAPGATVMATGALLGPDPVPITVVARDATVNRDTRNLRVRAEVGNPRGVLVPGMAVQVRVPLGAPVLVVTVPNVALRRAAYGDSVFVITPDDGMGDLRARQRFIRLGEAIGEEVIVLEGLRAGDRFAAAGSFKLRDGAKIMPRGEGGRAAPHGAPGPPGSGAGGP